VSKSVFIEKETTGSNASDPVGFLG